MRLVLQRVRRAAVHSEGVELGRIGPGLLVLAGIAPGDDRGVLEGMARKALNLRIFPPEGDPEAGGFDRSLLECGGELLVVSQFTLHASCRKGRRPGFSAAAPPDQAEPLFEEFLGLLRQYSLRVETGRFGAAMQVELVNDGPVTIWLDSDEVLPAAGRGG